MVVRPIGAVEAGPPGEEHLGHEVEHQLLRLLGRVDRGEEARHLAEGPELEAGIIDPKKVTRSALQNAASIAGLLLTTEALVAEIPEKKKKAPAMPGGGGMDMGGMGGMDDF